MQLRLTQESIDASRHMLERYGPQPVYVLSPGQRERLNSLLHKYRMKRLAEAIEADWADWIVKEAAGRAHPLAPSASLQRFSQALQRFSQVLAVIAYAAQWCPRCRQRRLRHSAFLCAARQTFDHALMTQLAQRGYSALWNLTRS